MKVSNPSRTLFVTPGSGVSGLHSQPSLVGLSTAVVWEEEVGTAKKLTLLYIYEGTLIPVGIEVLRQGGGSLAVTPLPECKGD